MSSRTSDASSALAYERIRTAIVEGRFALSQRLIEQSIAEELELSRTPIREAIRRLEAEGLVVSERNKGAFVRPTNREEIADLYEVRARLEGLAAELAASRATPDDLDRIRRAAHAFSVAAESDAAEDDLDRVRSLNLTNKQLHAAILEASHNERLAIMLQRAVDSPLVFSAFRTFSRTEQERSNMFHLLMAEAIVQRRPDRAGPLMIEHILLGRDAVLGAIVDGQQ